MTSRQRDLRRSRPKGVGKVSEMTNGMFSSFSRAGPDCVGRFSLLPHLQPLRYPQLRHRCLRSLPRSHSVPSLVILPSVCSSRFNARCPFFNLSVSLDSMCLFLDVLRVV